MFVSWSGADAVAVMSGRDDVALIVISNPGTVRHARGRHRLDLEFWDTTEVDAFDGLLLAVLGNDPERCQSVRRRLRPGAWEWRPPMRADAARIARFVSDVPCGIERVHVCCEYGRSRSRAVAEWLGASFGTVPEGDRGGTPNPLLARLLARQPVRMGTN